MTHPLNLLTWTLGRVTFSPVAAKSATGTLTPDLRKSIDAHASFFVPYYYAQEKPLMGLCGAAYGQAGFFCTSSEKPRIVPAISDSHQFDGIAIPKQKVTIMSTISILASTVRVLNGKYSLNDLHDAAGGDKKHQPAFFLRNAQTKELIAEITSANMQSEPVVTATSGANKGTYVCKELVYAYAMWVSPKFNLAVIRAFDSLQASSSPAPAANTTVPRLAAPKTTIITTIETGCAPVTRTVYGDVAVMPESALVELLDEITGSMQFMADAYNRLDAVRSAAVAGTGVVFDPNGSARRVFDRLWAAKGGAV